MKKVCLTLALFIFITSVPSFAMKVILNDNNDRRVPSRCSGPVEEYSVEEYTDNTVKYQPMSDYNSNYVMDRYMTYYKPLLSQDMREELIGTTWYYPKYVSRYDAQKVYTQPASKTSKKVQDKLSKRYLREAADYYTQDTLGSNPDKAYPAGFDM